MNVFVSPSSTAAQEAEAAPKRIPLGLAQRSVWLDTVLGGDKTAYQLGSIAHIASEIDVDLARQAVRQLMACHDALRLRVAADVPEQWIAPAGDPPLRVIDLSAQEQPEMALQAHIAAAVREGFALGDASLLKVDILRLGRADWRILMLCHHLIADGISLTIAQQAWLDAYRRLAEEDADASAHAEPLARSSIVPLVTDDEAYAASDRFEADVAHFKRRLAEPPALLFDGRPRPDAETAVSPPVVTLDGGRFLAFAQQARAAGTTAHRALIAGIAVALARRTGRKDFVIGNALHRRDASTRRLVGMMAGIMPVRCEIEGRDTLARTVTRLGAALDADMRHQRAPIDAIARALDLGATRPGGLFDIAITILPPLPHDVPTLGGRPVTSTPLRTRDSTALAIHVSELADGGFRLEFVHNPDILPASEIVRIAQRVDAVLGFIATKPTLRVNQIDGLTRHERVLIEASSYGAYIDVPAVSLTDLFAERVAEAPDAPALIDDAGSVSYADLDAASNRVAQALVAGGIAEGSAIGVCMPRSRLGVALLVGILKARCVYLPLDPDYPILRRKGMIEDAAAPLLFTLPDVAVEAPDATRIVVVADAWPFAGETVPACARKPEAEDTAYITFTSGSTGRPKGVAVPHRAAVNLSFARQPFDPIGQGDRVLAAISISFDVSFGQLMLPLLRGAAIVIAGDIRRMSPPELWAFLERHRVTSINSVPSLFEAVHAHAPARVALKRLILGGEPFSGTLARRLAQSLPQTQIINAYGPTEACIDATIFPFPERGFDAEAVLPIGLPLANYSAHILGPDGDPVALGVLGEVHIGGAGLAHGYVGAPELTAEKYIEHPELGRLYRTGDLARWREDGLIAFHGRADKQVKIRGFRIELSEIEAALLALPGVQQTAVIARPSARGDLQLVAYMVMAEGEPLQEAQALRRLLGLTLPVHMLPAAFVAIPALPLTANGKLDHKALPAPEAGSASAGTPARTPTEKVLAEMVMALLGRDAVVMEDDFFALGGHSLLATQLATRARAAFGRDIPIRLLFETPQLGALAAAIDALQGTGLSRAPLQPRDASLPAPLSFTQERLHFLEQLNPGTAAYNIPMALRLSGPLDTAALIGALHAVIARHDSLRTTIRTADGVAYQHVAPSLHIDVAVDPTPASDVEAHARAEAERPFDLATGPLIRARLLRLSEHEHVALVTLHHIISDGWSSGVFMRELATFYAGKHDMLPPLPVQFSDYAAWQRAWLTGAEMDRQLAFWRDALADAPEQINLPLDYPRPAKPSFRGDSVRFNVDAGLTSRVAAAARDAKTSTFVAAFTAYAALLSRWSGDADLVIGTPIANRSEAAIEGLIGFFANTLALRARVEEATTAAQLLTAVRAHTLAAFEHQDVPFERLVEALNPKRDTSRHPLFQVMFVYQNDAGQQLALDGLTLSPLDFGEVQAKFDLTLTLTETRDGLCGQWSFARDLFSESSIASLGERYVRILEALVDTPDLPIAEIALAGADERLALTNAFAGPPTVARTAVIPDLFEAAVARQPDAIAVVFNEIALTFAELNTTANRLAHTLLARGLAPEQPVAVLLPRSEQLVVAALAIMKAGGVYMPIDPKLPVERRSYMIDDAKPACVLTTREMAASLPEGTAALDIAGTRSRKRGNVKQAERAAPLTPDSLCYLIYTSGSTGQPKAVAVSHGALAHLAHARLAHDPIAPGDRVLAALSVGFDVSVGQIVTPLLEGATVVVSGELSHLSGREFWALLQKQAVTHVNSGPAFLDAVLPDVVPGLALKRLMLGGEPFAADLARRLAQALPGVEIFNMYGPSETCIDATCHRATGHEPNATLPIGRPLPGYRVYVLDRAQQPVPPGFTGEIYIGGPSLARGYLNRDTLTAERFIVHPEFGRLYRTGDLGRWSETGALIFAGRVDAQVKIRGFRIELGEIESALKRHEAIAGAAVAVRRIAGRDRLVAYIVPAPDASLPEQATLRATLARALPDYMLPDAVVAVPHLPLTTNGKLDIRALPEPKMAAAERTLTPPRHDTDEKLLAIWGDLLGHRELGIDDNFFDAGGHSLMALRLISAIKTQFGQDVTVGTLFQRQTVRLLADALLSGESAGAGPLLPRRVEPGAETLVCVHPVGGGALCYLPLVRALGRGLSIYGLQAEGFESAANALPRSIDEMAQRYVQAVRQAQPKGPYRLLGHSFGGQVAFAMARQLRAAGEVVSHLILLDSSIPESSVEISPSAVAEGIKLAAETGTLGLAGLPEQIDSDAAQRLQALVLNNVAISAGFDPGRVDVPVHYVEALGDGRRDERSRYWLERAGAGGARHTMACGHYEMLAARSAEELAGLVTQILRDDRSE